ncbi:MAG: aminoacyl-tRNA hydrolase, partial [Patescibacteria group bacterium]
VVVHDDLDLSLGTLNIRRGGSSAGHHGIDSINNVLPNRNYLRVRVGVGKDRNKVVMTKQEGAKYVLTNFSASEQDLLAAIKKKCVEALFCCLEKTLTDCQNIYNQKISNNLPMED